MSTSYACKPVHSIKTDKEVKEDGKLAFTTLHNPLAVLPKSHTGSNEPCLPPTPHTLTSQVSPPPLSYPHVQWPGGWT